MLSVASGVGIGLTETSGSILGVAAGSELGVSEGIDPGSAEGEFVASGSDS